MENQFNEVIEEYISRGYTKNRILYVIGNIGATLESGLDPIERIDDNLFFFVKDMWKKNPEIFKELVISY